MIRDICADWSRLTPLDPLNIIVNCNPTVVVELLPFNSLFDCKQLKQHSYIFLQIILLVASGSLFPSTIAILSWKRYITEWRYRCTSINFNSSNWCSTFFELSLTIGDPRSGFVCGEIVPSVESIEDFAWWVVELTWFPGVNKGRLRISSIWRPFDFISRFLVFLKFYRITGRGTFIELIRSLIAKCFNIGINRNENFQQFYFTKWRTRKPKAVMKTTKR